MIVIGFSDKPEEIWCVAGWAFRQLRDDVLFQYPQDSEMAEEFALAETQGGLSVDLLESDLAARVTDAIQRVALGILSGAIRSGIYDQAYGNAQTVEEYRKGLEELLTVLSIAKP